MMDLVIGTAMAGMAAVVFAGLLGAGLRYSGLTEESTLAAVPVARASLSGRFTQASVNEGRAFIQASKLWVVFMQDAKEAAYFMPAPAGGHPVFAGGDWNGAVYTTDPEGFRQKVRGWGTGFLSAWASEAAANGLFEYGAVNSGLSTDKISSLMLLRRDGTVLGILRTFDYSSNSACYAVEYTRPGGDSLVYQVKLDSPLTSFGVVYSNLAVYVTLPNPRSLPGVESKQFSTVLPVWR
jgi:hypothetical protein